MTTEASPTRIDPADKSMDAIVALCKRRGFIYPASEIYGGINGFWDYGPLGVELKNNLRDRWWRDLVKRPPVGPDGREVDIVGIDSAIIQNPSVWVASGHVGGFSDPMQTCRQCKKLFRADHIAEMLCDSAWVTALSEVIGIGHTGEAEVDTGALQKWAQRKAKKLAPGLIVVRDKESASLAALEQGAHTLAQVLQVVAGVAAPCPNCGGDLTEAREFNLMFESHAGAVQDDANKVYLRPETAQGIFTNFKNVLDTMRVRMPFGIAQIGKSFRNEVTPRNFIFRSREFEQMEMEWFCHPDDARKWYDFWVADRQEWWESLGVDKANLLRRDHDDDELAHYSTACADVEYLWPFTAPDFGELEGISHRGCFDLSRHQEHSKQKLEYFDQERNERYIPHVIEPAAGLTRGVLLLICEAFTPDETRASKVYLRFNPSLAPIQAAVFPLVNKDGMPEVAEKLYRDLRSDWTVQCDVKQSIGKRYARMDEAGTPFCFTIDSDTLNDQTVTVRYRDTQHQERIGIDTVRDFMAGHVGL
ncbi:MAG: glycine--tRNA ligase [Planctomycetes bacterium]|nr:glycine--tRNA ligase [Planctomycetota bacterium]MDP6424584.1 glycine--tRNA ligase [Planctomycetota bacterium]